MSVCAHACVRVCMCVCVCVRVCGSVRVHTCGCVSVCLSSVCAQKWVPECRKLLRVCTTAQKALKRSESLGAMVVGPLMQHPQKKGGRRHKLPLVELLILPVSTYLAQSHVSFLVHRLNPSRRLIANQLQVMDHCPNRIAWGIVWFAGHRVCPNRMAPRNQQVHAQQGRGSQG